MFYQRRYLAELKKVDYDLFYIVMQRAVVDKLTLKEFWA